MRTLAATASAVCVSLGAVTGAVAADLGGYRRDTVPYYYPPPPFISAVSWNGLYIGLQTGYVWGNADFTFSDGSGGGSSNPNGWVGGGYAGYNWQSGNFVLGFEADIEGGNVGGSFANAAAGTFGSSDLNWDGSLRGRMGIAQNRTLFYVTGGWAFGQADLQGSTLSTPPGCCSTSADLNGWTLGGGIEYAFSNELTIRGEYRFTDFGSVTADLVPGVTMPVDIQTSAFRVGAGYKF